MAYLIIVSCIWALSFSLIKGTLASLDSNFISFARMLLSFAIFLPFLRPSVAAFKTRMSLIIIGAIQFGFMYTAYIAAYRYLPAHMIALLTTTTPLFVAVIYDLSAKKIHPATFCAAMLAVAGGMVIKYPDQPLRASLYGVILLQASNLAFALGQVAYARLMARNPSLDDKHVFGLLYGGAVIVTGAFSLATTDYSRLVVEPMQLLTMLYLGVIASGLCFFLWNKGAARVDSGVLAVMNNLKIPLAIIVSLLILREPADYARLTGGFFLMAAGLYITERARGRTSSSY